MVQSIRLTKQTVLFICQMVHIGTHVFHKHDIVSLLTINISDVMLVFSKKQKNKLKAQMTNMQTLNDEIDNIYIIGLKPVTCSSYALMP